MQQLEEEGNREDAEPAGMLGTYGPVVQETDSACAERSKHSRPALLSLESPACTWPSAGVWELGSHSVLSQQSTDKAVSLWPDCLCRQYDLCWTPAFLLEVWNFGTC